MGQIASVMDRLFPVDFLLETGIFVNLVMETLGYVGHSSPYYSNKIKWYPKKGQIACVMDRPKSLCVTLDGKDGISNAARVRTGAVIATRSRHTFPMVYDT